MGNTGGCRKKDRPLHILEDCPPAWILPLCARWPLPFFISPACIFLPISPLAWASRICRRGFCLRLHAGPCLSSPRRRAFFIMFLRQLGRLESAGRDFASVCTLAPAVYRLTGVHFSSRFSASLAVSTVIAGILPPCARWYPAFPRLPSVHFSSHFSAGCSTQRQV